VERRIQVLAGGIDARGVGNDLLLGYGLGAAIGTFVAYRQRQRNPEADIFATVARWSAVGVVTLAFLTTVGLR